MTVPEVLRTSLYLQCKQGATEEHARPTNPIIILAGKFSRCVAREQDSSGRLSYQSKSGLNLLTINYHGHASPGSPISKYSARQFAHRYCWYLTLIFVQSLWHLGRI